MNHSLMYEVLLNLWSNKMRSFLALLGVLIGTAAVVALLSSGIFATRAAVQHLKAMGTELISVSMYPSAQTAQTEHTELTAEQMKVLSKQVGIDQMAPSAHWPVVVSVAGQALNANVLGVTYDWAAIAKFKLHSGRFLNPSNSGGLECVIGHAVSVAIQHQGVFPRLGMWLSLGNQACQVVGIGQYWPSNFFIMEDLNRSVMVPLKSAQQFSRAPIEVHHLLFKLKSNEALSVLQSRLQARIQQWLPNATLYFKNPEALIDQIRKQRYNLTLLLSVIGGIALLVGGIGIMNVMLVALAERKSEIGLRMALGASPKDIQRLFLTEAVVLTLLGGALGILIGSLSAFLIASFSHWQYTFLGMPVLIGFLISVLVGMFFGFYPAYRASLLNPIEGLRSHI